MSSHAKPDWVPLAISRGVNLNADHLMHLKVGYRWSFTLDFRVHCTMKCLLHSVRYRAPPHLQLSRHVGQLNDGFTPTPCEPNHDGIDASN
jgi:arginyl-tRNA--protein-N-Asp/Glu arginylyltransferase